jgi:hypothetical protein
MTSDDEPKPPAVDNADRETAVQAMAHMTIAKTHMRELIKARVHTRAASRAYKHLDRRPKSVKRSAQLVDLENCVIGDEPDQSRMVALASQTLPALRGPKRELGVGGEAAEAVRVVDMAQLLAFVAQPCGMQKPDAARNGTSRLALNLLLPPDGPVVRCKP